MKIDSSSEHNSFGRVAEIIKKIDEGTLINRVSSSTYTRMNWFLKILYNIGYFLLCIPVFVLKLFVGLVKVIGKVAVSIWNEIRDFIMIFVKGSIFTKASYFVMGIGNLCRGQFVRGLFFLAFEVCFFMYQLTSGIAWMTKLKTLGDIGPHEEYNPILDTYTRVNGDDSFKILLYGGISVILCLVFIYVWRMNWRQSWENDKLVKAAKKVPKFKDDLNDIVDAKFHKSLLTLPIIGMTCFTILPIIFMIAVAFTNYDGAHDGYSALFTWTGFENFKDLLSGGESGLGFAFKKIFGWTVVWAIFATFTNYFLGMLLAIMINKKGIKLKKLWRGIFVLTIAIPQFISLLYMSKLFAKNGLINGALIKIKPFLNDCGLFFYNIKEFFYNIGEWVCELLIKLGVTIDLAELAPFVPLELPYDFWGHAGSARALVIIINIWIGIPYLMLVATGILMNIPEDLYESAKIDGANGMQRYFKITLPYMLFVTGPYLLTNFIGNMSNFNVIYLLGGGATANPKLTTSGGTASDVDLLVTWLFKITMGTESNYKLASVIGIMIFLIEATVSIIGFNLMSSNKNEEDFQ